MTTVKIQLVSGEVFTQKLDLYSLEFHRVFGFEDAFKQLAEKFNTPSSEIVGYKLGTNKWLYRTHSVGLSTGVRNVH